MGHVGALLQGHRAEREARAFLCHEAVAADVLDKTVFRHDVAEGTGAAAAQAEHAACLVEDTGRQADGVDVRLRAVEVKEVVVRAAVGEEVEIVELHRVHVAQEAQSLGAEGVCLLSRHHVAAPHEQGGDGGGNLRRAAGGQVDIARQDHGHLAAVASQGSVPLVGVADVHLRVVGRDVRPRLEGLEGTDGASAHHRHGVGGAAFQPREGQPACLYLCVGQGGLRLVGRINVTLEEDVARQPADVLGPGEGHPPCSGVDGHLRVRHDGSLRLHLKGAAPGVAVVNHEGVGHLRVEPVDEHLAGGAFLSGQLADGRFLFVTDVLDACRFHRGIPGEADGLVRHVVVGDLVEYLFGIGGELELLRVDPAGLLAFAH